MDRMSEEAAYERYNEMLDEFQPLSGIACNPFSQLLRAGDPVAYDCGFNDWCDSQNIEIEEG